MVDSWTDILASASDVFKHLAVTCNFFFTNLESITELLWNGSPGPAVIPVSESCLTIKDVEQKQPSTLLY